MNENKGRDIVSEYKDSLYILKDIHPNAKAYFLAEGYLAAIEKAERILVAAMKQIVECKIGHWPDLKNVEEALAQWESEK